MVGPQEAYGSLPSAQDIRMRQRYGMPANPTAASAQLTPEVLNAVLRMLQPEVPGLPAPPSQLQQALPQGRVNPVSAPMSPTARNAGGQRAMNLAEQMRQRVAAGRAKATARLPGPRDRAIAAYEGHRQMPTPLQSPVQASPPVAGAAQQDEPGLELINEAIRRNWTPAPGETGSSPEMVGQTGHADEFDTGRSGKGLRDLYDVWAGATGRTLDRIAGPQAVKQLGDRLRGEAPQQSPGPDDGTRSKIPLSQFNTGRGAQVAAPPPAATSAPPPALKPTPAAATAAPDRQRGAPVTPGSRPPGAEELEALTGGVSGPTPRGRRPAATQTALNQGAAAMGQALGETPGPSIVSPGALAAGADPFYTGGSRNPSSYLPPEVLGQRASAGRPRPAQQGAPASAATPARHTNVRYETGAMNPPGTPDPTPGQTALGRITSTRPPGMSDSGWAALSDISAGLLAAGARGEGLIAGLGYGAQGYAAGSKARTKAARAERREDRRDYLAQADVMLRIAASQRDKIAGSYEDDDGRITLYTESGKQIPTASKKGKKTKPADAVKEARLLATLKSTDEFGVENEIFDRDVFNQMVAALGHPELRLDPAVQAKPELEALEVDIKAGKVKEDEAKAALTKMYKDGDITKDEIAAVLERVGWTE